MGRKKSNEEYVIELADKNPKLEVLEPYVNSQTPILHRCKIHNIEWKIRPSGALYGYGCYLCKKEQYKETKQFTHDEYCHKLKELNIDIIPLEKYQGMKTPILHKCLKHNVEWIINPDNILRGCGCRMCGGEKIAIKNGKTHEQYVGELAIVNPNIEVLGTYSGANKKILHRCKIDNYKWSATPANILYGTGCPKCGGSLRRTPEEYRIEVANIHENIEVIDNYINITTRIKHKCNIHNYIWETSPQSILLGSGCPLCGRDKLSKSTRKTQEEYENELANINPNVVCIDEYITSLTPIKHKCLNCNNEWIVAPSNLLAGHGCPRCKSSNGEKIIKEWLISHNILFEEQKRFEDCRDKRCLPFDYYLPDNNSCIEYDGLQHYEEVKFWGGKDNLEYTQNHDKIKTEYCEQNNIDLLRIPYYADIETELSNFLLI